MARYENVTQQMVDKQNKRKLTSGLIKNEIWSVIRPETPYDTGWLFSNITMADNGVDIVIRYDPYNRVPYIDYLEEGTLRSTKHVGFIEDRTFNAIVDYLETNKNRI